MGDMADFYLELALARGGNPFPQRGNWRESHKAECKHCGSTAVHWREDPEGWRLYDDQRQHPGNRYVQHTCPTSAEGFDDV